MNLFFFLNSSIWNLKWRGKKLWNGWELAKLSWEDIFFIYIFYLFLFSWKYVPEGGKKWDMEKFERWSSWEVINLKNWNLKKNSCFGLKFAKVIWVSKRKICESTLGFKITQIFSRVFLNSKVRMPMDTCGADFLIFKSKKYIYIYIYCIKQIHVLQIYL